MHGGQTLFGDLLLFGVNLSHELDDFLLDEGLLQDFDDVRTLDRVLQQHVADEVTQILGVAFGHWRKVSPHDFHSQRLNVIGFKWPPLVAHFVQDTPKGPDVRLVRVRLVIVLLWRHVIRRADVGLSQVPDMVQDLADTEISQPDVSFEHEDVGRFQVSV